MKNPCATDQMQLGIPEASSNSTAIPRWLCAPAYASGASSDHNRAVMLQYALSSCVVVFMASTNHSAGWILIIAYSNHLLLIAMVAHFLISGKVVPFSCASVLAETITVDEGIHENIHKATHATKADLPMPRPDERAIFKSSGVRSWVDLCLLALR